MNRTRLSPATKHAVRSMVALVACLCWTSADLHAQTKTWDGIHGTQKIEVTVVYFVPSDRTPLADWKDRVDYYCRRIKQFHAREFQGQSRVEINLHPKPFVSKWSTPELRRGDPDAIFFRTLGEIDKRFDFGSESEDGFPILLVLSDINHRPLDDFYRLKPGDIEPVFEGIVTRGNHFPGSKLGGARATYSADRGVGLGLVSADGWRVPYRGSDCVVYHEGLGHTVGLPHPTPGNHSVMSGAQYQGWLSESWIDDDQKNRLGWTADAAELNDQERLFTEFRARPEPPQPRPGQPAKLKLDLPGNSQVKSLRVRFQTSIDGPWIDATQEPTVDSPEFATVGVFDRPTPVSYRIDVQTNHGDAELWGYFQVRDESDDPPKPLTLTSELSQQTVISAATIEAAPGEEIDLLRELDPAACFTNGQWEKQERVLQSNKAFGVRIELPYSPPDEYKMTIIVEPLDPPNGLLLGLRAGDRRFAVLVNHTSHRDASTALENVDGKNVGNETTYMGDLFKRNRLSQVVANVHSKGVRVTVDGRVVIDWKGTPDRLSLSDYWKTPNEKALFLGTYDCAYRFHRISIEPTRGRGERLGPRSNRQGEAQPASR